MTVQEIQKRMKAQCLNLDILRTLPPNIIEYILTLMPIKDALRTSILSRKWRYIWTNMPKLVFKETLHDCGKLKIYKLVLAILHILVLHKGPIEELEIFNDGYKMVMVPEFGAIILLYLSEFNNVKRLILKLGRYYYKPPPAFFSLQGLELLQLSNCNFEPPITFHGFSGLKSLTFIDVQINPQILKRFLSDCPLLEHVCLMGQYDDFPRENTFTFVELLNCVPLIETLQIQDDYMRYLATGGMPQKLSTSLIYLKNLHLEVCLMEQDEISSALCMIRSSPNLEGISLLMYNNKELPVRKTSMDLLDLRDNLSLNLRHLKGFWIGNFSNLAIEIKLVKFFLAKSPMLEDAWIELSEDVSVDEEMRLLRDLVRWPPYLRASPSAKLTVKRV